MITDPATIQSIILNSPDILATLNRMAIEDPFGPIGGPYWNDQQLLGQQLTAQDVDYSGLVFDPATKTVRIDTQDHTSFFSFVLPAIVGAAAGDVLGGVVAEVGGLSGIVAGLQDALHGAQALLSAVVSGVKTLWTDVLHPIIGWVDTAVTRIRTWLGNTFGPVFSFLRSVRDAVTGIYNRFLRPILDAIDFVHQLDQLLQVFHINLLQGLDNSLQSVEQRIDGVLNWIYGKLNDITNVLTTIVTADGFFQRYTLLRSLARDVDFHWQLLANAGRRPLSDTESYRITRAAMIPTVAEATNDTLTWLQGGTSGDNAMYDDAVTTWEEFVQGSDDVTA